MKVEDLIGKKNYKKILFNMDYLYQHNIKKIKLLNNIINYFNYFLLNNNNLFPKINIVVFFIIVIILINFNFNLSN